MGLGKHIKINDCFAPRSCILDYMFDYKSETKNWKNIIKSNFENIFGLGLWLSRQLTRLAITDAWAVISTLLVSEANFDRLWAQSLMIILELRRGEVVDEHNFDYFDCSLTLSWRERERLSVEKFRAAQHQSDMILSCFKRSRCKLNPQSANLVNVSCPTLAQQQQKYLWNLISCHPYQMQLAGLTTQHNTLHAVGWFVFSLSRIDILQCAEFQSNLSHNFYGSEATALLLLGCCLVSFVHYEMILNGILSSISKRQTSFRQQLKMCLLYWQSSGERFAVKSKWKLFFFVYTSQRYRYYFCSSFHLYIIFYFAIRNLEILTDCVYVRKTSREKLC